MSEELSRHEFYLSIDRQIKNLTKELSQYKSICEEQSLALDMFYYAVNPNVPRKPRHIIDWDFINAVLYKYQKLIGGK